MIKLYNSLTKEIEEFKPLLPGEVGFYICGPTVYHFAHIGNLRTMLLGDVLRRALEFSGLRVNQVMNITDVGHLTSDGDTGEDKLEKNASSIEDVHSVVKKYTDAFLHDLSALNIKLPGVMPKATEHIDEQIEMIRQLIEKGFAYESADAVYFDVTQFPEYTQLTGQSLDQMMLGARQEVVKDPNKKSPYDFVLWFKAMGRYANHIQRWESPWGVGFPGWHIECSAMSKKYLGAHFDLHVGGIDLKFPHHTNEIAQSENANGEKFVNYWVHGEHLLINEGRMGKSEGNFLGLAEVTQRKFNPLAYRYLVLTSHYRSKLNFSWESLQAAQNALNNLYAQISTLDEASGSAEKFESAFQEALESDLNLPQALAVVWDLLKNDEIQSGAKLASLLKFDQVLGLKLKEAWETGRNIPAAIKQLVIDRNLARDNKDFAKSDELRRQIEQAGFTLEDTIDGQRLKKKF